MSFLTNIKTLWAIIIVLIIVNIGSLGSIWFTSEHRSFDRRGNYARSERNIEQTRDQHFIPKRLHFSNDQQEKFDSLAAIHRENLSQKIDEIRELREQLVARMKNQEFNSSSEDLIQEIGDKQAELELLNFRNFRDVMSICDEEQKQQFVDMMQRAFRPRGGEHRGGRRGGWD